VYVFSLGVGVGDIYVNSWVSVSFCGSVRRFLCKVLGVYHIRIFLGYGGYLCKVLGVCNSRWLGGGGVYVKR